MTLSLHMACHLNEEVTRRKVLGQLPGLYPAPLAALHLDCGPASGLVCSLSL